MAEASTVLPGVGGLWVKWQDPAVRGAVFKVCSCLCFSGINGFVRYFTLNAKETGLTPLPATELAFFETFFGLLFILPWILSTGKVAFKASNPHLYLARAFAASFGIILWFTALSKMPIVQVVAFKYTAPIFTILGAKIFLGEKCGWARAMAIGTALAGALMITAHELFEGSAHWTDIGLLILFPVGATACYSTSAILAKKQVKKDSPQTVCLYLFLLTLPILGFAASFQWVTPLAWQWPYLAIMGGLLATAYIFLQNAYVIADITFLIPMSFTRLIAGAVIGMVLFNEWPTIWTGIGSFFILLATISLCKNEVQHMKAKNDSPLPAAA
ncbi:MAG: DMT family transporter [Proteobacteria bacterium]|nr:DMT family transporter [Pseudomonadota bacterium]